MERSFLLCEADYARDFEERVIPTLSRVRQDFVHTTKSGAELYTVRYDAQQPRGTVVLLHGLGESAEKYRELCYYFLESGFTVLAFDQRGHGRSTRLVETGLIHTTRFSHYVEDLHELLCAQQAHLPAPRYLYAHSMGGGVAALYLAQHQGFFQKAVLSSPMIAMQYKGVPRFLGYAACAVLRLFGRGKKRFVGMSPSPSPEQECLERAEAQSVPRFEAYRKLKLTEPRFHAARPTVIWVQEALRCTRDILKRGAPEGITIPVRVYAAELETLVLEAPQRAFAKRLPNGEFHLVSGTKHEIYFAKDEVFHPYIKDILTFFEERT